MLAATLAQDTKPLRREPTHDPEFNNQVVEIMEAEESKSSMEDMMEAGLASAHPNVYTDSYISKLGCFRCGFVGAIIVRSLLNDAGGNHCDDSRFVFPGNFQMISNTLLTMKGSQDHSLRAQTFPSRPKKR